MDKVTLVSFICNAIKDTNLSSVVELASGKERNNFSNPFFVFFRFFRGNEVAAFLLSCLVCFCFDGSSSKVAGFFAHGKCNKFQKTETDMFRYTDTVALLSSSFLNQNTSSVTLFTFLNFSRTRISKETE